MAVKLIEALRGEIQDTQAQEEAVGAAKTLWEAGEQAQAFELLLSAVKEAATHLALHLPTFKKLAEKVAQAGGDIEQMETRLAILEEQVNKHEKALDLLAKERDQAVLAAAILQQKNLLGQIAYTMSDLLERSVFGQSGSGSLVPLSVSDYANNSVPMTAEQQERWSNVQAFFAKQMRLKELFEADKYLRWLGNEPCALPKETTFAQLHSWAGVHCNSKAVIPVQQYLRVLNQFSSVSKPLAPEIAMDAKVK